MSRPAGPPKAQGRTPSAGARPDVRPAKEEDLAGIASVGSEAFSGLRPPSSGHRWVEACWRAAPRTQYWVAVDGDAVVGYILWLEKGGFRAEAVWELEQVAVRSGFRGKGIGEALILTSLDGIRRTLLARGARLKLVEVTTGSEQGALGFYSRVLGTEVVGQVPDVFRGEEYILIARERTPDPS